MRPAVPERPAFITGFCSLRSEQYGGAEGLENWTVLLYRLNSSLALQYDFQTRFRSGEIPIAIANYGMYNALSVFARNWTAYGYSPRFRAPAATTVDHTTAGTVTGAVMMSSARNKSDAWEFLRWWASAQTQTMYMVGTGECAGYRWTVSGGQCGSAV